ncbi:hypothetical protein B0F90DRAFT_1756810, partial [Multifurca ochricompacta]
MSNLIKNNNNNRNNHRQAVAEAWAHNHGPVPTGSCRLGLRLRLEPTTADTLSPRLMTSLLPLGHGTPYLPLYLHLHLYLISQRQLATMKYQRSLMTRRRHPLLSLLLLVPFLGTVSAWN